MRFSTEFLFSRDRKLAMSVVGRSRKDADYRRPVQDRVEAWLDSLPFEEARAWAKTMDEIEARIRDGVKCG